MMAWQTVTYNNGFLKWVKWATAFAVLVGLLWTGWMEVDKIYARSLYVQQQIGDVKLLYLQGERRALEKEKFELEVTKEERKLYPIEKQRLKEIEVELQRVTEQIKSLEKEGS